MSIFRYSLITCILLATGGVEGQGAPFITGTIKLSATTEIAKVNPHIKVALNNNEPWNIEKAKQQDFFAPADSYHFGVTDSTVWVRFRVINEGAQSKKMFLELENPIINNMQVFDLSANGNKITKTGSNIAYNSRQYRYKNHTVLLELMPDKEHEIFVAISSQNPMNLQLTLKSPEIITKQQNQTNLMSGFYFGAIFLVATLAILMFLLQKQVSYLYYLGLLTFLHITLIPYIFGINHAYILPNTNNMGTYITSLAQVGTMIFFIMFTHRLFQDAGLKLPPYIREIAITIGGFYCIKILFLGPSTLHLFVLPLAEISLIVTTLVASIKGVRQKSITALLFLLSWVGILSAALAWVATIFGSVSVKFAGIASLLACLFQAVVLLAAMGQNVMELQEDKVAASKYISKIRALLDNINQGIITFDESLCIDAEFSAFLASFYKTAPTAIPGKDVMQFVFPNSNLSANDYNQAYQSLGFLAGEKAISWQMNHSKLPSAVTIFVEGREKHIALLWSPMVNDQGIIERLMLSIKDITEKRLLEAQSRTQIAENKRFLTIISELIIQKKSHVYEYLTDASLRIKTAIDAVDSNAEQEKVLIELHTIKGGARLLGTKSLSNLAHSLEETAKQQKDRGPREKEAIRMLLLRLEKEIIAYSDVFTTALCKNQSRPKDDNTEILQGIISPCLDEVWKTLEETRFRLSALKCHDGVNSWNPEIIPDIRNMLMHGINNSIDHGYLNANGHGVGAVDIKLELEAYLEGENIILRLKDNGKGIDLEKVRNLAQNKGIYFGNSDEILIDALFVPGISTTEGVTATSGRGIGLSAVREIAKKSGGSVRLEKGVPQGAELVIILPAEAVLADRDLADAAKEQLIAG